MLIKQWVAQVIELNENIKEFPKISRNSKEEKLNDAEVMDILEYKILNSWRQEIMVKGLNPVCGRPETIYRIIFQLKSCELSMKKQIPKKVFHQTNCHN